MVLYGHGDKIFLGSWETAQLPIEKLRYKLVKIAPGLKRQLVMAIPWPLKRMVLYGHGEPTMPDNWATIHLLIKNHLFRLGQIQIG